MRTTYTLSRYCATCRRSYVHPLAEGWDAVDGLWRCPDCSDLDAVPWFTDQHAREAAERMKAWAETNMPRSQREDFGDADWLNLARVALELRPR